MNFLSVIALTPDVNAWLADFHHPRILHVFEHACNLINEHQNILSIVTPQIGNGPFNLVVESEFLFSERLNSESRITVYENQLCLDELSISLAGARLWNPHPDWKCLHRKRNEIARQLKQLPITNYQSSNSLSSSLIHANLESSKHAAQQLAGLGNGLTPAGDDFIMGTLYATWIIHPVPVARVLASKVADVAAPLTASLSAAWLKSAGRGEAGILWHKFFDALLSADTDQIHAAIDKIKAVGATSGADAFAGFMSTFNSYVESQRNDVMPKFI